jgi:hypothetical protein
MTSSRELDALAKHHAALEAEVAEKARELAEVQHLVEETRQRQRLPVLEALRIASPCRADWSKMDGDDRVRHCGECKKYVYNLSAMTHAEALELIESLERAPCVRYYERSDGTILFSDCVITRSRRSASRLFAAGAVLAAGASMVALAVMPPPPAPQQREEVVTFMGLALPEPADEDEELAVELDGDGDGDGLRVLEQLPFKLPTTVRRGPMPDSR